MQTIRSAITDLLVDLLTSSSGAVEDASGPLLHCHRVDTPGRRRPAKDDDLIADAGLVAAELLSNAVQACRTRVVVRLDVYHDHIRIGVFDDGPGKPELRKPAGNDPGRRGLAIVKALSTGWGTTPHASGKCVWSEIPVVTSSSSHLNCIG